ncbi:MAG: hypothetical protein HC800_16070 [Phormidesmis sp. RL_2_1]|nr:hypothetical protein [Phormidesmis sp. RL_2_1]
MTIQNLEYIESVADLEQLTSTLIDVKGGLWFGSRGRFASFATATATAIAFGENTYTLAVSFTQTSPFGAVASSSSVSKSSSKSFF